MGRLSQRVSAMWSTVKCPKCHATVRLSTPTKKDGPPPSGGEGKRWSFIWLMPRGDFCPECDFPLSKYFGRLKWIRTMMVGVTVVLVALALEVIAAFGQPDLGFRRVMRDVLRVGAVIFAVGAVGVAVGGRRGP